MLKRHSVVRLCALMLAAATPVSACPGDCNGSGQVTFDDLVCAVFAFGAQDANADCDLSGTVDFNDLVCILFSFGECPGGAPIVMDGRFDDWAGLTPDATDPLGDASGAFDLTSVTVDSRGTTLFVRFDTNNVRNLQSGSSSDGTLVLHVEGPTGIEFTADLRNREFELSSSGPFGGGIGHADASFFTLPTHASDEFELTMDLSVVNARLGDTVSISFTGGDTLDAPITHMLDAPADPDFSQPIDRPLSTDLRVVNLNILQRGLVDGQRGPGLRRLVRGIDADVYCLQEFWNSNPQEVRDAMALSFASATDGRQLASSWNVAYENGTVLATTLPLEVVNVPGTRESGGIVTLPSGARVFVLSIHLKCCGSIGTSEDIQRINAATAYASFFESLQIAEPGLGFIVSGDWNLVGSRTPLDILTSEELGFVDASMLQVARRSATTWRDQGSSFVPGRLDLLVYSPDALELAQGVVLDSRQLDASALAALGVQAGDSESSDHLMLVTDYRVNN